MRIPNLNHRATIIGLTAAMALTFGALTRANAGECPADQRRPNGTGQPMSALGPSGVADKVVTFIELNREPVSIQGRQLRARRLDIQPGGVVPWHSHSDRPALLFITEGEITEYASTCATPIVHKAGEITAERSPTSHWWKNLGAKPVVIYAFDLFRAEDKHDEHMM
ncbi:MAG: cupin domain-containing protein [Burkholderiaceae bacterium]|nr:cupin domain-containing protein [Burkholderiaceae bacterium]